MSMKSKGFTLIELLVVISVISLLSSIILAAVSGARNQAAVTAGLDFADHNLQVYGADAVANYTFDSTSGGSILDTTGNNRTLGAVGGSFALSTQSPNGKGMSFVSGAAVYGSSTLPNQMTSPYYTLSAWVYFTSLACPGGDCTIVSIESVAGGYVPIQIYLDASKNINCYSDPLAASTITFGGFQTGTWYHIACALNNSPGLLTAYVNGKVAATTTAAFNQNKNYIDHVYVGGDGTYPGISGYIDTVSLYTHAVNGNN